MNLSALVERILSSPPVPRPVRFADLVDAVRVHHPDADVCDIDIAARPFHRGEPGAYTLRKLVQHHSSIPGRARCRSAS